MAAEQNRREQVIDRPGEEENEPHVVKADIVSLDGHRFRINYGVPQDVTDRLYELFWQDEELKYEDIPEDLKAYEVKDDDASAQARRELAATGNHSG